MQEGDRGDIESGSGHRRMTGSALSMELHFRAALDVALYLVPKIKIVEQLFGISMFIEKSKIAEWSLTFCGRVLSPKK